MIKLQCHVAGIPHRQPAVLPSVGDTLQLVPEPSNPYDPNAIKVMFGDVHLGYVPKTETATVRTFALTRMYVTEVEPTRRWSEVMMRDEPIAQASELPVTPLQPVPEPHTREGV